jgi:hypothetical protein
MTQEQYNNFKKITKRICNGDSRGEDLMHDVIMNLQNNTTFNLLDTKSQSYFFSKTIRTQYTSNNSKFQRDYRRYEFDELPTINEPRQDEEPYQERPTMSWVKETLDTELNNNPLFWYEHGIFNLYLQEGKLESLHRRTQIPKYSLRETLKEVKNLLKLKWNQYIENYEFTGKT